MTGIMDHSAHYEEALPALDAYLSTEEKVILSDLSVNPSQIQQWAVLKINEYTNRIRSLKSVYNAGALVNRTLPREVLGEIFANLHHREESRDVELRYLHVCRLWRHLIFRTPVFWVNMLSKQRSMYALDSKRDPNHLRHLELYLRLSRAQPFTLSLRYFAPGLLRTLEPHTSRLSSLTVTAVGHISALNDLLRCCMPALEHLEVAHSFSSGKTMPALAISRRTHPRLQSLVLPFESLGLACLDNDLHSLEVSHCRCESCSEVVAKGTGPRLSKILGLCPSLRRLKIKNILHMWGPLDSSIAFPTLCELIIEDHRDDLGTFLTRMVYSETCAVHLGTSAPTTLRACLPPGPLPFPQLSETDEVRLSTTAFGGWSVMKALVWGKERLCVRVIAKTSQLAPVAELAQLFTTSMRITTLTIDPEDYPLIQSRDDPGAVFRTILSAFPHLEHLDIRGYDGRRVMLLLSETSKEGLCYCPRLRDLRIVWYYGDDELYKPPGVSDVSTPESPKGKRYKAGPVIFSVFCDIAARMLHHRKAAGRPLEKLRIGVYPEVAEESLHVDAEGWEPSVLRRRLRRCLVGYESVVDVFPMKPKAY